MDGLKWEIKCPKGKGKSLIHNTIHRASAQSPNIIVDLYRIKMPADKALVNAEFNEYFINQFKKCDSECFVSSRNYFQFYIERGFTKGKKEKTAWVSKDVEGNRTFGLHVCDFATGDENKYTADEILADDELAQTFLQALEATLDKYHFKYEYVVLKKTLSMSLKGSNVSQHIENYMLRLADMLASGINSEAYVRKSYRPTGVFPIKVEFSQFAGKAEFRFAFENHLLPGKTESNYVDARIAIAILDPKIIGSHELNLPLSDRALYVFRGLQKIDLPSMLNKWTAGFGKEASFKDVVEEIHSRANS